MNMTEILSKVLPWVSALVILSGKLTLSLVYYL